MKRVKKNRLKWIKGLMLFSQVLLLLFTAQWLVSQYNEQQALLKTNITKVFTDVQQRINDSLVLTNVIDTAHSFANIGLASGVPGSSATVALSAQGRRRLLSEVPISRSEEKRLFRIDTILFNDIFVTQMKKNGWNFNAEWINSSDSGSKAARAIFIQSSFFTNANGVVVNNYYWFLIRKLLPQLLFSFILLAITTAAFLIALQSLRAQIKLGSLKDDFISNMSHELKTPIATVKVALEALGSFNMIEDPQVSREYLGMAAAEMNRLELLATRVLNTSLLETGKMYLQQERYSLKKLVEEVIQNMYLRLAQHGARITFEAAGNSFMMPMDRLHMQGVLVNLVDNSLKYGQEPVRIHISLTEQDGAMRLALTDNGPGIPEEYKEKVFEKFFRVPTGNRHNTRGYGLGLSYAAQVMRQHQGSINVDNIAGGGCVFTLTF